MSARKCGISSAKGVYSIQIDPDDWVEPSLLEELYHEAIAENADMVIYVSNLFLIKMKDW